MSNTQFKGRQKGSTKKSTLISDPSLGNYKIIVDDESYNLIYIDPETKKEKIIGYYTQLANALKCIVRTQTIEKKSTYTIKEYITELKTTLNNLNTLINNE
jgi:signal-transduction protein with cAMP-binding, CBS, and nucleotidyltransferase domain